MTVEEQFDVVLEPQDGSYDHMRTIGDMHSVLFAKLTARNADVDSGGVWDHVVQIVAESVSVDPSELRPGTRFIEDLGAG